LSSETLSEPLLATARSRTPFRSKSPAAAARGARRTATLGAACSTGGPGGRFVSTTIESALRQGIARSTSPSVSASISVIACGELRIVWSDCDGKVPLPLLTSSLSDSEPNVVTAMSGLASPSKFASATAVGPTPTA
jgi:hypothetical protein